jgi:hypothetical protein
VIRVSVAGTLDRIDAVLADTTVARLVVSCARQADELAVVVDHLAGEERVAGGRARTLTALDMLGRALGELATELRTGLGVRS